MDEKMRLLREIIRREGVNLAGKTIYRKAVRGIILDGSEIFMIYSRKNGDYKFPGGGVDEGETFLEALVREVREESGAQVNQIIDAFGKVIEYDFPREEEYELFKMTSYYYICSIDQKLAEQSLEGYEIELGFQPVWINIDLAIQTNQALLDSDQDLPRWVRRETFVLQEIKEQLVKNK